MSFCKQHNALSRAVRDGTAGLMMYLKENALSPFSTLYVGTVGSSKELRPSDEPHDATVHEAVINLHSHRHENLKPQVQSIII
jgi:hypothetical protein